MEVVIKDLAQKFENIGESAREYYARRAAMVSMVVAIIFAFVANIDAIRLFQTFVKDQQLTAGIIARSEEAQSAFVEQQAKMDKLLKDIKAAKDAEEAKAKAEPLKELDATANKLREELANLAEQGLPISYSLYPAYPTNSKDKKCGAYLSHLATTYCQGKGSKSIDGKPSEQEVCVQGQHKVWRLIGHDPSRSLGGPFWYNIVSSLGRVVQVARAAGLGAKPKPKEGAQETAGTAAKTEQPQNPVEAFKVAAQVVNSEAKLLAHW